MGGDVARVEARRASTHVPEPVPEPDGSGALEGAGEGAGEGEKSGTGTGTGTGTGSGTTDARSSWSPRLPRNRHGDCRLQGRHRHYFDLV